MSVNNSRIIGSLQNGTEVFIVGRNKSNYFTYTDKGFVSYASSYDGKYYLFKTTFEADGLSLSARKACDLFPKHCDSSPNYSCKTDVFAEDRNGYQVFATKDISCKEGCENSNPALKKFKLVQPCSKAPNDKLFAGIWYNLVSEMGDILFEVIEPRSGNGFAEKLGKKVLAKIEITFIPFSNNVSFFHQGQCSLKFKQSPFKFFEWWTKGKILSESCDSKLTSSSKYCVLIGSNCLDGNSYRYCMKDEDCGSCHGVCSNGGQCLIDGKGKFYCENGNQPVSGTSNQNWVIYTTLFIFFAIVGILLIVYAVRKWRVN